VLLCKEKVLISKLNLGIKGDSVQHALISDYKPFKKTWYLCSNDENQKTIRVPADLKASNIWKNSFVMV